MCGKVTFCHAESSNAGADTPARALPPNSQLRFSSYTRAFALGLAVSLSCVCAVSSPAAVEPRRNVRRSTCDLLLLSVIEGQTTTRLAVIEAFSGLLAAALNRRRDAAQTGKFAKQFQIVDPGTIDQRDMMFHTLTYDQIQKIGGGRIGLDRCHAAPHTL